MGSKSETAAITRALLALVTAVDEIDDALVKLALAQDQQLQNDVNKNLVASREARTRCLEHIQALLSLMSGGREQYLSRDAPTAGKYAPPAASVMYRK
jgi:hypothetical protein